MVDVDLAGRVRFANPAAVQLFPDLEQTGAEHPFLAGWQRGAARRHNCAPSSVREVMGGPRRYQQAMHYVAETESIRIFGLDVTDRRRIEEQIQEANREAGPLNKDLEQFAYVASHDLQEPLRMVSGYMQLLSERYQGQLDDKADESSTTRWTAAERMRA